MIAVVPEPPLLLPELATGAGPGTAAVRAACREAARRLAAASSTWIVVGADAGGRRTVGPDTRGSFAGFGADVTVALGPSDRVAPGFALPAPAPTAVGGPAPDRSVRVPPTPAPGRTASATPISGRPASATPASGRPASAAATSDPGARGPRLPGPTHPGPADPDPDLPLPLLIAGWLRPDGVRIRGELVAPDAEPAACLALGAALAGEDAALLVVGDGAATHSEKAPGYLDERAGPFDAAVADALRTADPAALAALDPLLAAQLWAVGRAPWQVLAGATADRAWTGELLHSSIPFGVAYHVAVWRPA